DSDALMDVTAAGTGQLRQILDRENAATVRRVLHELNNARDRELLLRFYIAEEDKDRISADYGLTGLQFNRVLHRARQRYRELFLERTGGNLPGMIVLLVTHSLLGAIRRAAG
ncbi:MAG: hypothetical protein ACLGI9_07170, partial [Thermoanaerobaculia bacterium]